MKLVGWVELAMLIRTPDPRKLPNKQPVEDHVGKCKMRPNESPMKYTAILGRESESMPKGIGSERK